MSLTPDCLDDIIGLSKTNCECFTTGQPSPTSKSDLWLDELEGMNLKLADSIKDCEEGSLWDILIKARTNSIKAFRSDLMASLMTKYKKKREPCSVVVGSADFKTNIDLVNTYAGIRVWMANIISGVMTVKRIGLVFDSAATFNISVFDGLSDSAIMTFSVTSQANKLTWYDLPLPLNLDMNYEASQSNPNYYFVYEKAAFKPKNITASCGCSGSHYKYYWNTSHPTYKSYAKHCWSEYIMLTGTAGDSIGTREDWGTSQYLNRLILDVDFKCKVSDLICKSDLDFENNELAMVMAYAVRFKAGEMVMASLLASAKPNIYTMSDREGIAGRKKAYSLEYQNRINYLTENINYMANDCLKCDDFNDIVKTGILA